jgi:hypothetical protein
MVLTSDHGVVHCNLFHESTHCVNASVVRCL